VLETTTKKPAQCSYWAGLTGPSIADSRFSKQKSFAEAEQVFSVDSSGTRRTNEHAHFTREKASSKTSFVLLERLPVVKTSSKIPLTEGGGSRGASSRSPLSRPVRDRAVSAKLFQLARPDREVAVFLSLARREYGEPIVALNCRARWRGPGRSYRECSIGMECPHNVWQDTVHSVRYSPIFHLLRSRSLIQCRATDKY